MKTKDFGTGSNLNYPIVSLDKNNERCWSISDRDIFVNQELLLGNDRLIEPTRFNENGC